MTIYTGANTGAVMSGETQRGSSSLFGSDVRWKTLDEITEPGAYVSRGSGELIRVPRVGKSLAEEEVIGQHSGEPLHVTQISTDPFIPISRARIAAANLDVEVDF